MEPRDPPRSPADGTVQAAPGPTRRTFVAAAAMAAAPALRAAPPALAWQPPVEVARGRAEQGPWRQNESRYDYVDDPTVAIAADGDIAVAWVDQGRKAVLLQRFAADGRPRFGAPVDVSRQPATFSWLPRLAFAPDAPERLLALWQEIVFAPGGSHGGDIFFAGSDDGGRSFGPPLDLSRSRGGDGKGRLSRSVWHNGSLDLAAGAGGLVHAAWTEYEGALWHSRSLDGGRRFSAPQRIAGSAARPARAPSLAVGDGAVFLAWTVGEDPDADIRLAVSRDAGASFGAARVVGGGRGFADAPKLALGHAGVLHLAYSQSEAGPSKRAHIRATRSEDGGRSFAPPREVSSPLPAGATHAGSPALATGRGGAVVVASWEIAPAPGQQPRGLAMAISTDGGRRFSAPALVPGSADPDGGTNGSRQGILMRKLAVGADATVAIVNSSFQAGVRSRVWLLRGRLPP